MKVETRTITPEVAKEMLKRNVSNRPLNSGHVNHLARQMKDGLWVFDGQPIRLTESGGLLDGQHRLSGIVESNRSFDFIVVTGISSSAFTVMDTGRNRQASDVLAIDGFDYSKDGPTVIRDIMNYKSLGSVRPPARSRVNFTNAEILKYAKDNSAALIRSFEFVAKFKKPLVSRAKLTSFHYIFSELNSNAADEFISKLCTGLDLDKSSPIYVLREKLITDSMARTKMPIEKKYGLLVKCWNMWRTGKLVDMRLRIPDEFPKAV